MTEESARKLLSKAEQTNAQRDKIERGSGFAPPGQGGNALWARTVMQAIYCGLRTEDWNAVAEGLIMLRDLEFRLRDNQGVEYEPWERLRR
jgi:hypothetical protein